MATTAPSTIFWRCQVAFAGPNLRSTRRPLAISAILSVPLCTNKCLRENYSMVVKWSLNSLKLVTDEGGFYAHEILLENRIYFLHKLAHFRHHVTFQLQEYDPLTLQPS